MYYIDMASYVNGSYYNYLQLEENHVSSVCDKLNSMVMIIGWCCLAVITKRSTAIKL